MKSAVNGGKLTNRDMHLHISAVDKVSNTRSYTLYGTNLLVSAGLSKKGLRVWLVKCLLSRLQLHVSYRSELAGIQRIKWLSGKPQNPDGLNIFVLSIRYIIENPPCIM